MQPILVRPHQTRDGEFEIVAGERRWRAANLAEMHQVPAIVCKLSNRQALEGALIENIQREDLTPLELAEGYYQLQQEFHHTQERLARIIGKSRSHIANTLRLRNLQPAVKDALKDGKLSAGHARVLLNAPRPEKLARKIVDDGLSVRETENLAKRGGVRKTAKPHLAPGEAWKNTIEADLSELLGLKATVSNNGRKYKLTIDCSGPSQLTNFVDRLKRSLHSSETNTNNTQRPDQLADRVSDASKVGPHVFTNDEFEDVRDKIIARQSDRIINKSQNRLFIKRWLDRSTP